MLDHRIQNCQQLSHAGDPGHFFQFARRDEPLIERSDHRIALGGDQHRPVQRGARGGSSAPQHVRRPRRVPLSWLKGAIPTNAAICRLDTAPNSSRSASRVRLTTGPTPGTLRRRFSCSCQTGPCRIVVVNSLSNVVNLEYDMENFRRWIYG